MKEQPKKNPFQSLLTGVKRKQTASEYSGNGEVKSKKQSLTKIVSDRTGLASIKVRMMISMLISVCLIVLLGLVSYQQASRALVEKTEASNRNNVEAVSSYISLVYDNIEQKSLEIITMTEVMEHYLVVSQDPEEEEVEDPEDTARNNAITKKLQNTTITSDIISDIHLLGFGKVSNSTLVTMNKTTFEKFVSEGQGKEWYDAPALFGWASYHEYIDQLAIEQTSSVNKVTPEYATTFFRKSPTKNLIILVDLKPSVISDSLEQLNFGKGSWSAFIAPGGRQMLFEGHEISETSEDIDAKATLTPEPTTAEVEEVEEEVTVPATDVITESEMIFTEFDFYNDAMASEAASGYSYENYDGAEYLFTWAKIGNSGALLANLTPKDVILSEVEGIRNVSMIIILLAVVISAFVSFMISNHIGNSIKKVNSSLKEAASGDLTVTFDVNSKDEFGILARGLANMIEGVRRLVKEVDDVSGTVTNSASDLSNNSMILVSSTKDISLAIDEIAGGVVQQASDTEQCLIQMSKLADRINDVYDSTHKIEEIADYTKSTVQQGLVTVSELNNKSKATTTITKTVIQSIEELDHKSRSIGSIVNVINDIASQTNLLSLNASIEAARAGDAGRGFAVVAEEIRKLADQSMGAAKEIARIIDDIQSKSEETSESAKLAEENVYSQAEVLGNTISAFEKINSQVEHLVNNLDTISVGIQGIESAKADTLDAIQNISAVSEETASSTEEVGATSAEQLESVTRLSEAANHLADNAKKLDGAISIFRV